MIEVSREGVGVADSAKFQRRSLSVIAKVETVDRIITDSGAPPEVVADLQTRGVDVLVV
jgi:DeoR family transcriptional regulator of aga operon